uniref:Uncharacterized protein LOC109505609 n=1 Tax=Elaeis guineensis var. tenera TaxID=51953 RepID=A0A6J0PG96_ELAGV|nr:uncharacterized protein LOC109505609 [Elaeis guineensis]
MREHPCWEASYRGLKTTSLLYAEWWGLDENERKYNLGLLLIQIFIIQGNYKKAQKICEHIIKDAPEWDPKPRLLMSIIKMMLAMQRMLDPETTEADLLIIKNMRDEAMKQWENYFAAAQKPQPPDTDN